MADFYWPAIGIVTGGAAVAVFIAGLVRRRWDWTGLYVAVGCLAMTLLHMVAPFRGTLDPEYPGYSLGLLRLEGGIAVGIVAGGVYLLSFAAMTSAIRNRSGPAVLPVAALSTLVLLTIGGYMLFGLVGFVPPFRLQLGQYFQLQPLPATLLAAVVILLPFAAGLRWSSRRAHLARG